MPGKHYIGDGVYAEIEDGVLKLTTSENTIYLDREVWGNLRKYVQCAEEEAERARSQADVETSEAKKS